MHRKPGSDKFERVTWDFALERIAKLMKDDRDKNFIAKNSDGVTVNRWTAPVSLAASATPNESGYLGLQGWCAARAFWHSTIRRAFDTDRRWPVWPQHSVAAR